jgi:hypothetical protein
MQNMDKNMQNMERNMQNMVSTCRVWNHAGYETKYEEHL